MNIERERFQKIGVLVFDLITDIGTRWGRVLWQKQCHTSSNWEVLRIDCMSDISLIVKPIWNSPRISLHTCVALVHTMVLGA